MRRPELTVAFVIFLFVNATLFLRPAELVPPLIGLPIYEVLVLLSLGLCLKRLQWQFRWRVLKSQPISLCVVALLPAVVLSHATHVYLWGMKESTIIYVKLLVYYGLLVTLIDSPRRLRLFLLIVAACASLMVSLCVVDYLGLHDFEFIKHLDTVEGTDATGSEQVVFRMRGTGIFHDPNDIAMLIVSAGVLCAYFLGDRSNPGLRFLWLLPLASLGIGLFCTRSRGGLLAAGAAVVVLTLVQFGKRAAAVVSLLGVGAVTVISGRQGEIDLQSGTGYDRLTLWREGFEAIQSFEILFGIGQGEYGDMAGLVAHNSYIHALVELGLFGGTLFLGCFFFAVLGLYRLSKSPLAWVHPGLSRFRPYMGALLAGWCTAMLSLSRCYVVPTYLVIGLSAVYLEMGARQTVPPRPLMCWDRRHCIKLLTSSAAAFACFFLVVKVFT